MRNLIQLQIVAGLAFAACTGCGRQATLQLDQDFAPPAQRSLALTSGEACFTAEGEREQLIATFPLPGSQTGPRAFVLYLDVPASGAPASIGNEPSAARGVLIQEVGQLKGAQVFAEGRVDVSAPLLQPNWRTATLDLRTERGARLTGRATFERSQRDVRRLARPIATEIEALAPVAIAATAADAPGEATDATAVPDEAPEVVRPTDDFAEPRDE